MAYGTVKVDNITFTNAGIDQTITVSGIVASISGNITATGTIQGQTIIGTSTVSGASVTGDAGLFTTLTGSSAGFTTLTGSTVTGTTANFNNGTFTSQISGTTVTGNLAQFTTLTGGAAGFTSITGTTVTGTTANFVTVSGTTVTGNAGQFTTITGGSAGFTSITGATVTGTVGNFGSGSAAAPAVSVGTTDNGLYSPGADQLALSTNSTERLRIDSTGQIEAVSLGTAAAPTFSWTGDPNTGIYSPGADQVAISSNSLQRLAIDANGNINIDSGGVYYDAVNNRLAVGTTSPAQALHVNGNIRLGSTASSDENNEYEITSGGQIAIYANNAATQDNTFVGLTLAAGVGSNQSAIRLFGSTSSAFQDIRFSTNNQERARIDSSGRLLVGTSTARSNFYNSTGSANLQVEGTTGATTAISITSNSTTATSQLVLNKSRGTTVGSNTVVAADDFLGGIQFQGSDGTEFVQAAAIFAQVDGTPGANDMPGRLVFSTTADGASSPTERMRIDSSGRVGIGTTNPGVALHVNGDIRADGIYGETDTNTSIQFPGSDVITFNEGGSEAARIDSSGRLLVGTSSSFDGSALQVNGNISQSSIFQQYTASFSGGDVSSKTLNIVVNNSNTYASSLVEVKGSFARGTSSRRYYYRALFVIEETGATVSALFDESATGVTASLSFSGQTASLVLTFSNVVQKGAVCVTSTNSSADQYLTSVAWA